MTELNTLQLEKTLANTETRFMFKNAMQTQKRDANSHNGNVSRGSQKAMDHVCSTPMTTS